MYKGAARAAGPFTGLLNHPTHARHCKAATVALLQQLLRLRPASSATLLLLVVMVLLLGKLHEEAAAASVDRMQQRVSTSDAPSYGAVVS